MKCRNCANFRQSDRVEFGNEILPDMKPARGTCSINNTRCKADDECRCGSFTPR
ncbi:MAG: hypothetical protein GX754_01020 [Clostridiaceae bacterium]|nr:hypothetical protein [Clostridiaceae bacterium]